MIGDSRDYLLPPTFQTWKDLNEDEMGGEEICGAVKDSPYGKTNVPTGSSRAVAPFLRGSPRRIGQG